MLLLPEDEEMYEVRVRRAVRLLAKEQRVKVAMISWRVGRGSGGLRAPTAEDVPTLQSAIRTSKPPEIVVVAVNGGSAKLRTDWKTVLYRSFQQNDKGGAVPPASYKEAACVERGTSYLSIHTLTTLVASKVIVGSFDSSDGRQNTVARLTFAGSSICFANWGLPRRTGNHKVRLRATYEHLAKTYRCLGCPEGEYQLPTGSLFEAARREYIDAPDADAPAEAARSTLRDAARLFAGSDHLFLAGAFESRTVDGKDQLLDAMQHSLCLPQFHDADPTGACTTSYFQAIDNADEAVPRKDVPKGRTSRVFYAGSDAAMSAKVTTARAVPLSKVTDRPLAVVYDVKLTEVSEAAVSEAGLEAIRCIRPDLYYAMSNASAHLAALVRTYGSQLPPDLIDGAALALRKAAAPTASAETTRVVIDSIFRLQREAWVDPTGRYHVTEALDRLVAEEATLRDAVAQECDDGWRAPRYFKELLFCYQNFAKYVAGEEAKKRRTEQDRALKLDLGAAVPEEPDADELSLDSGLDASGSDSPLGHTSAALRRSGADFASPMSAQTVPAGFSARRADGSSAAASNPASALSMAKAAAAALASDLLYPHGADPDAEQTQRAVDIANIGSPVSPSDNLIATPGLVDASMGHASRLREKEPDAAAILIQQLLSNPSDIPHELCFEEYSPPSPTPSDLLPKPRYTDGADVFRKHHRKLSPRARTEDSNVSSTNSSISFTDGFPAKSQRGLSAASRDRRVKGAYSPAYYLPPYFTLLWSLSREKVAEGQLPQHSAIEEVALATLYSDEHWDMLHERGRLLNDMKEKIRERELRRREEQEMEEVREGPFITRAARDIPDRGEFFRYAEEWKKRSEIERQIREEAKERKERENVLANRAKMSANSIRIMRQVEMKALQHGDEVAGYKSPVTHWYLHAVDHMSKRQQEPAPAGIFEPVINPKSYQLASSNRPPITERMAKAVLNTERKLAKKREELEQDPDTSKARTFRPWVTDHAKKLKRADHDALLHAMNQADKNARTNFMRKKKELLKDECPFAPALDDRSEKIMSSRPRPNIGRRTASAKGDRAKEQARKKVEQHLKDEPSPKRIHRTEEDIVKNAIRMSKAEAYHQKRKTKEKSILDERRADERELEKRLFKPRINSRSKRMAEARAQTISREEEELEHDERHRRETESMGRPPRSPEEHRAASRRSVSTEQRRHQSASRPRSVSPYQRLSVLTTGSLISRPRRELASQSVQSTTRDASPSASPSVSGRIGFDMHHPQFFTPLRGSASPCGSIMRDGLPPSYGEHLHSKRSTQNQSVPRTPSSQAQILQHLRHDAASAFDFGSASPPFTAGDAAQPDPYQAIEDHLSAMCGVLEEYRSLENYASSISGE